MTVIYDLIFAIFSLIYFPYLIVKRKWHPDFSMRFGKFSEELKTALAKKENIWVHAVSVGEVQGVSRLAQHLRSVFPGHRLVISTVTKTGYEVASKIISGDDILIYAPLDFSFIVRRYVARIKPKMYIAMETELWPNLFSCLRENRIPVAVVNGRISDRAFKNYRLVKYLMKRILSGVDILCMQSRADCDRIITLGAPKEKVHQIGNVKFDDLPAAGSADLKSLGFIGNETLWIAGSTHPGEEEIVLNIFKSLSGEFKDLRLMIAPRHIERTSEVARLIEAKGLTPLRLSQVNSTTVVRDTVIVVDTIGKLRSLYGLAKLVFVGKSLSAHGGQNMIEPAALGKAILIGPYTENFKDVVDLFLRENAVIRAKDADGLLLNVRELLRDPRKMEDLGALARAVAQKHSGATDRTATIIRKFFQKS
ncbi:MAG TPA: 3-deoxy-D-manno-octulosonic acid transferase [Candidatus Omnitrophota bacterium]|nr:3-deoxy-D-manno-octulosonic acid transferase [Candidatus Omnitrophota bacterium]HPD84974.1 3-deoxy-D-manno-octulosonic acid transferase [Candidatus Omnitrophota bacterium]HRZ03832.1 3-deoxy-D-manno-octulosonic acid transferase [Candidatus Omnitrophota bacterium]